MEEVLALPSASSFEQITCQSNEENADGSCKLDALGPVVVNSDGTLSRIQGWDKLGDVERERTQRIIVQRNARRLKELKEQEDLAHAHSDTPTSHCNGSTE
jgi:hypothetical protein